MENENFVYVAIPLDSVIASGITSDATVQVSAADGVIVIERCRDDCGEIVAESEDE